jgi:mRNA-degrading endonuclease RelE of RelBE toxin-antitoxin system
LRPEEYSGLFKVFANLNKCYVKMKVLFSGRALNDYQNSPERVRRAVDKQLGFLLKNLKHSSLRAKKYDEDKDVWQARITLDWRFYFQIRKDIYYIITIIKHPE